MLPLLYKSGNVEDILWGYSVDNSDAFLKCYFSVIDRVFMFYFNEF